MNKEWMIRWIEGRQTDTLLKGQSLMGKADKAPILLLQTISSFQNTSLEHLLGFEVCFKCRDTAISRLPKICPLRVVCIHTYSHTCMHRYIHTHVCTHTDMRKVAVIQTQMMMEKKSQVLIQTMTQRKKLKKLTHWMYGMRKYRWNYFHGLYPGEWRCHLKKKKKLEIRKCWD